MSNPERPAKVAVESTPDPAASESLGTGLDLRSTTSMGEVSEVLSLLEETASVAKQRRITGGVRIETRTELRQENAEVSLDRHTVDVTRVPVNRLMEAAPEVRTDGDTTIIPVEERFIVVKQFFLKEEVHIRHWMERETVQETVELRRQQAVVRRDGIDGDHRS